MIRLEALDRAEAVRYLGDARVQMNSAMEHLLDECEEQVLRVAEPKFLYKVKDLPCPGLMAGNDIAEHLAGCSKAVLLAATLGTGIDRMLRVEQVKDMSRAVVLDALASVAIAVQPRVRRLSHRPSEILSDRTRRAEKDRPHHQRQLPARPDEIRDRGHGPLGDGAPETQTGLRLLQPAGQLQLQTTR